MRRRQLFRTRPRRVRGISARWRIVPEELKEQYGGHWVLPGGNEPTIDRPRSGEYAMWLPERGDMLFALRRYCHAYLGTVEYYLLRRSNGQRAYIQLQCNVDGQSVAYVHGSMVMLPYI